MYIKINPSLIKSNHIIKYPDSMTNMYCIEYVYCRYICEKITKQLGISIYKEFIYYSRIKSNVQDEYFMRYIIKINKKQYIPLDILTDFIYYVIYDEIQYDDKKLKYWRGKSNLFNKSLGNHLKI